MRKFYILAALVVGLLIPQVASAGCVAKWDAGTTATYDATLPGYKYDVWKGGAQCTSINTPAQHYHVTDRIQWYNGSIWQSVSHGPSNTFLNNVINKYWRIGIINSSVTGPGQGYQGFFCADVPNGTLIRMSMTVYNEDTGTNDVAYTAATAQTAGC